MGPCLVGALEWCCQWCIRELGAHARGPGPTLETTGTPCSYLGLSMEFLFGFEFAFVIVICKPSFKRELHPKENHIGRSR